MKKLSAVYPLLCHMAMVSCIVLLTFSTAWAAGWQTSTVESAGIIGEYSSIAVDASGTPHIAYRDATNKSVKYAVWNGSSWQTVTLGPAVKAGYSLSGGGRNGITVDADGNPHVLYFNFGVGYVYSYWNGSAWMSYQLPAVPDPHFSYPQNYLEDGHVSIAVDTAGVAHAALSYYGRYGWALGYWNSASGTVVIIDEDPLYINVSHTGSRNAIAVDSSNRPHISYESGDGNGDQIVKYITWTGSAWTTDVVGSLGAYWGNSWDAATSIAVDSSNRPHIAYYGTNSKYVYARWTGSAWSKSSPSPFSAPVDGEYISLALDANDTPHIAMQVTYDLVYATLKSGVWSQTTLDSSSGNFCSIAVGSGKNVHISYYDDSSADLKYVSNARTTIVSPNGGETIASGSDTQISWTAPHNAEKFKLFYSIDNGATWYPVTTNFVTGSSYLWSVPGMIKTKKSCKVKVSGYTSAGVAVGSDVSDASFAIENVTFTSPNPNTPVTGGSQLIAAWTTHKLAGTPVTCSVSYTLDGGMTWKSLGAVAGDATQYVWDPVATVTKPKTKSRLKLVFKDGAGKTVGSALSPYFTVAP